jgi:hypothetical protein
VYNKIFSSYHRLNWFKIIDVSEAISVPVIRFSEVFTNFSCRKCFKPCFYILSGRSPERTEQNHEKFWLESLFALSRIRRIMNRYYQTIMCSFMRNDWRRENPWIATLDSSWNFLYAYQTCYRVANSLVVLPLVIYRMFLGNRATSALPVAEVTGTVSHVFLPALDCFVSAAVTRASSCDSGIVTQLS